MTIIVRTTFGEIMMFALHVFW